MVKCLASQVHRASIRVAVGTASTIRGTVRNIPTAAHGLGSHPAPSTLTQRPTLTAGSARSASRSSGRTHSAHSAADPAASSTTYCLTVATSTCSGVRPTGKHFVPNVTLGKPLGKCRRDRSVIHSGVLNIFRHTPYPTPQTAALRLPRLTTGEPAAFLDRDLADATTGSVRGKARHSGRGGAPHKGVGKSGANAEKSPASQIFANSCSFQRV